jgi:uncharacterized protein (TIGR03437 family)
MNQRMFPIEFLVLFLGGLPAFGQSSCVNFPANYVPFSSFSYVTAPNAAGDRLVVGSLAGGLTAFGNAIQQPATSINQEYCDAQVQLAPQHSYSNVYVPTAAERSGNFSAFNGLLVNPTTNQPYPNGIIPASQLGNPYFAWRIAPNGLNITSVQNAASNIAQGLPNGTIAQGAIFIVQGSGLGPTTLATATAAFQSTTLSNTSVTVTVGGTTANALMYYTSGAQLAALLPSNTPTGTGTISVTYNGQTSAQVPITVVANNLGIFTVDSSGQGPGIVTYADYSLVSSTKATNCGGPYTTCGAANPGDTLTIWATGLGPVSGSDAAGAGLGQAINVPLTVWLGGVQAPVVYQGRSGCCIGEDQIVFTVPKNAPTGCAVPLVVQVGTTANTISNTTLVPVANGSRNCSFVNSSFAAQNFQQLLQNGPPITFSNPDFEHGPNGNGSGFEDDAQFFAIKILSFKPGSQPFLSTYTDNQPPGTCVVYGSLSGKTTNPIGNVALLDAGASVTVKGPNGSVSIPGNGNMVPISATGTFMVPGTFTITGTGGADIGPFSASFTILALPTLGSPANNATVTRASGMTVTWTGGDPTGTVQIGVNSSIDNTYTSGANAICTAPASAGTFTIPPYVLLALPAGNFGGFSFGSPFKYTTFTAPGLDFGLIQAKAQSNGFGMTLK